MGKHFKYPHYTEEECQNVKVRKEDIELATFILEQYCGSPEELSMEKFENFTKMTDDSFFRYGTSKLIDLHLPHSTGNTFFYRMKYYVITSFIIAQWTKLVSHVKSFLGRKTLYMGTR